MKWMHKVAKCPHDAEVEFVSTWEDNGPFLLRVCQVCGRVVGWNRETQEWQWLGTMGNFTWTLRRSESVHRNSHGINVDGRYSKSDGLKIDTARVVDIDVAPTGVGQFG